MFSTMRRMWKEARAQEAQKEVMDILQRFARMDGYQMYELTSAYQRLKDELEENAGPISSWSNETKASSSKQLIAIARKAFKENLIPGSYAAALLGLQFEMQTLPGDVAQHTARVIEDWYSQLAK